MSGAGAASFISFEGIDGSGKSTQARLLADALRTEGREVVLTREPGGSPGAEEIRRLVLEGHADRWSAETEILLFTAARRDHLEKTIRPALAAGKIVITDRFADSTRLYQGARAEGLRETVDSLHALMIGTEPDLTFIIDMDANVSLFRALGRMAAQEEIKASMTSGDLNSEATEKAEYLKNSMRLLALEALPEDRFEGFGLEFQIQLRQGFLDLAKEYSRRCVVIDGARPVEAVAADIAALAQTRLAQTRRAEGPRP